MRELLYRLSFYPLISIELFLVSFFANFLALASSLYVIQVLNRYVSYGVDATLITLTIGVCFAILLEFAFRRVRVYLAEHISRKRNRQLMLGMFGILLNAKIDGLKNFPTAIRQEILQGIETIEEAYNASNLAVVLDLPFVLLFLLALFYLSTLLGWVTLGFLVCVLLFSFLMQRQLRQHLLELSKFSSKGRELISIANSNLETGRLFDHNQYASKAWENNSLKLLRQKAKVVRCQNFIQAVMSSLQALLSVAIYAFGAKLAVNGDLALGTLIGANILSIRALTPIMRFSALYTTFTKASQALEQLQRFAKLETDRDAGVTLKHYSGGLRFKDVSFSHPNMSQPLFESLDFEIPKGAVMTVVGENGSGKTSLAGLIIGLLEPNRGQILADGIELRQLNPSWWRQQITYFPQEARFLSGSIQDNLLAANPNLDNQQLNQIINAADLTKFIDESPEGLQTMLVNKGDNLALGQRKRLALARALAIGGRLIVFDEPTKNLDEKACKTIYELLLKFSQQGNTIILFSQDPILIQSATLVLDLNIKPVPHLRYNLPVTNRQDVKKTD